MLDFLQTAGKYNRGLIWCLIFHREQEKVTGLVEDMLLDFLQTAGKNNRGLIWCLIFYRKQEKVTGLVVKNMLLDFLQ